MVPDMVAPFIRQIDSLLYTCDLWFWFYSYELFLEPPPSAEA